MPQHLDITLPANVSTLLTDADVTAARVHNPGGFDVQLQATAGATPPASWGGAITLGARQTLATDLTLVQLFPGVTGANRVHARSAVTTVVSVSHA
jgi:hypothetical protein